MQHMLILVLTALVLLHSTVSSKSVCSSRNIGKGDPTYATRVAGAETLMTIDVIGYFNGANESDMKIERTAKTPTFKREERPSTTYLEACMTLPATVQDKAPKPDSPSVFFRD